MKQEPRKTITVEISDEGMVKHDVKALATCDCFTVPDSAGEGLYSADQIFYAKHHGLELPGHIIFDGTRYRTSRVSTYESLPQAVLALMRGN